MISLEHVSKRFGTFTAVKDLNLVVDQGELCCLIGPSGCGKSTILKMINRMIEPSEGTILVNGMEIHSVKPQELRRRIGYVIQSIGLFPHMTVLENIGVVPGLLKWDGQRRRKRSVELLELFGLPPGEYADKYPRELSGGQAQRVGVARALAADPDILLMDEPFGALDPITREHLQNQFAQIQKELSKTVVFVTHDIDEAIRLGSKVALIKGGELVQYASPETLLSSPKNSFVKQFVGMDRALKRLSRLQVSDFMRPAGSIQSTGSPEALRAAFDQAGDQDCDRFLWVTDDKGRILGWIDTRQSSLPLSLDRDLVRMEPGELSVHPDHSLKRALSLFFQQGVSCLPVVDQDLKLEGEVRLKDLLES